MQKYEYKQLRITDLLLNTQNPRFDPVQHQTQAIHAMIDDQREKLAELAKHIVANGLSPMEIVLVQPLGKQWLVREGNRRVTALKLINEPDLIPDSFLKIKREFINLNKKVDKSILDGILCAICTNEEIINAWILLKHTGENKGVGTVGWDAFQISRFTSQVSGKTDPKAILFESLREHTKIPHSLRAQFSAIKKTNFDRLIGDPSVRKLLGIEYKDGDFILSQGINNFLMTVLSDLSGEFSVGKIYTKADREAYLEDVKKRVLLQTDVSQEVDTHSPATDSPVSQHILGKSNFLSAPTHDIEKNSESNKEYGVVANTKSKQRYPTKRKNLIPTLHKLSIENPRIARIFTELKTLDCEQFPNATSVLFRVFIELSCDYYISNKLHSNPNTDSKLAVKIEAVANDIESKKLMTKHELRAARQMSTSQTQNQSVRTFHSYVHNKDFTPIPADLIIAWDDLWPFIEMMWR